ncbi:membrane protein [Gordonia spumicola]|uniref:Membrane protein n=1 Tax=Gordonia spumicola TaxID=589161 RepID=A0A7I9VDY7_9ACTN|nr:hemolysin family protein [Gordonia spumicola]GEE03524.1 membrane protein [Gordonia spumicola]
MTRDIVFIGAAIALTVLAGLFAAIDTAVQTVSTARVDDMVKESRPGAKRLRTVLDHRATYVGLSVLMRVVCETAATGLVAVIAVDALDVGWGLGATVVGMTLVSYIAVGVGPRTLGRQHAYSIGLVAAPVLTAIGVLLRPVTRLLILVGNGLTPGKGYRNGPFATEVEVREVVDLAQERGVVDDDERRMIQSVFEFGDTNAREVMVPRTEMIWIENDKSATQAMSLAVRSGHSRIPVIGENPDDIVGVVYLKDLVERILPKLPIAGFTVADVMRGAEFVPDSKPLDDVLSDMQAKRNHMALLVDEYGGIAGLVTIEDVLEEIVGEISDEYDVDEVAPIQKLGEDRYRVSARLPVEDLGELFGIEIDDDEVETVGGLLGLRLGRVPLPGAKVKSHGLKMTAEGGPNRLGRQRITTVVVRRAKKHTDGSIRDDWADDEPADTRAGDRLPGTPADPIGESA